MATPLVTIKALDHLVLTCKSVPKTIQWYKTYLGMTPQTFTPARTPTNPSPQPRHALIFASQKINLHQAGSEFEPKAQTALPGTADLCFIIQSTAASDDAEGKSVQLEKVIEGFEKDGIEVLEGGKVVERTGARGKIRSVYVRDPDGNLIELSEYIS